MSDEDIVKDPGRHHTKRGPGRIPFRRTAKHPAGTKLIRRFIRDARGEATEYRRMLAVIDSKAKELAP